MIRIGASTYLWASPFTDEALHLARHVGELGFDVLEVCIEEPERVTSGAIRAAAAEASVAVSVCGAFGPGRDVSHDDAAMRRLGLEYLKRCIDLAAAVGSPHVAGPMYAATGKTRLLPEAEREAALDGMLSAIERGLGEPS